MTSLTPSRTLLPPESPRWLPGEPGVLARSIQTSTTHSYHTFLSSVCRNMETTRVELSGQCIGVWSSNQFTLTAIELEQGRIEAVSD